MQAARGLILLGGSIGLAVLGWVVLAILHNDLEAAPDHAERIHRFALWMIDHRSLIPIAAAPMAVLNLWLLVRPPKYKHRWMSWLIAAGTTLWLAAIFVAVLIAFLQFVMPLYQYQPL